MFAIIDFLTKNAVWLDVAISIFSFLITTILTVWIIRQTTKLTKKQMEQEDEISKQQELIQKRQLKLDTFEYKNDIYRSVYKIFQLTGEIYTTFEKVDLYSKSWEQLSGIFNIYVDVLKIDTTETMWLLKQATYILPDNISPSLGIIRAEFDALTRDFSKLTNFPIILSEEEMVKYKLELLDDIKYRCKKINSYVAFIESVMPGELSIANLSR